MESMFIATIALSLLLLAPIAHAADDADEPDPGALIEAAMDHWRGTTSYTRMTMTIHRPDWERATSMRCWTEGTDNSIVRVTEPAKDAGSGTLLRDRQMWMYAPKVNRVIKVPSSLMAQSWMGSDFSNKDISRSTDIIDQYDHTLTDTREHDGHAVYVITSIPHEEAAVVWGKEILTIRDDEVLLTHEFFDQDGVLVKAMKTLEIAEMGGRTVAKTIRMSKAEIEGEWTEMTVHEATFDLTLGPSVFTLSNLRNPRQ